MRLSFLARSLTPEREKLLIIHKEVSVFLGLFAEKEKRDGKQDGQKKEGEEKNEEVEQSLLES